MFFKGSENLLLERGGKSSYLILSSIHHAAANSMLYTLRPGIPNVYKYIYSVYRRIFRIYKYIYIPGHNVYNILLVAVQIYIYIMITSVQQPTVCCIHYDPEYRTCLHHKLICGSCFIQTTHCRLSICSNVGRV